MYSTIPQFKIGDCSIEGCGLTETEGRKVGKNFICLNHYHVSKVKQRIAKANQRSKVRGLSNRYIPKTDATILNDKVEKEKWFRLIRTKLVGTCQCGCAAKSQKKDDMYFRASCCHIFPKGKFDSVKYHPLNYVERAFWGGCHSIMDDTSMNRWVGMADWEDIKAKFFILAPLLTEDERKFKFYTQLENLVYNN